jgi:hypothetical protein
MEYTRFGYSRRPTITEDQEFRRLEGISFIKKHDYLMNF